MPKKTQELTSFRTKRPLSELDQNLVSDFASDGRRHFAQMRKGEIERDREREICNKRDEAKEFEKDFSAIEQANGHKTPKEARHDIESGETYRLNSATERPPAFDFERNAPLMTISMTSITASRPILSTVLPGVETRAGRAILCRARK